MDVPAPDGVEVVRVETALELRKAALHAAADSDVVVMAAAVADFRPRMSRELKSRNGTTTPIP